MKKLIFILSFYFSSSSISTLAQVSLLTQKGTKIDVDINTWMSMGLNIFNKNIGNVGIGTMLPAYKLEVVGKVKISDSLIANTARILTVSSGSINDSILVIDPVTGLLKSLSFARFSRSDSTTADNGITLAGKKIQLGGNLVQATTITNNAFPLTIATAGTAFNLTGLTAGVLSDSLLTINATTGKVNRVNTSILNKADSTTATNGLTLVGKSVQLGGALTKKDSITTTATNTLAILGLQNGLASDSLMIISSGVLKKFSPIAQFGWVQGGNSFGAVGVLGTNDNNELSIRSFATERLRIDGLYNYNFGQGIKGLGNLISFGNAGTDFSTLSNGLALADGTDADVNTYLALGNGDDSYINSQGGKVGIGTSTPGELLDVAGNIELLGALLPGGNAGTLGQVLTSNAGATNTWQNVVTNIITGTGLTGGPITSTGTISLANTTVVPGAYGTASQVPAYTVDAQGRLTTASNTAIQIAESQVTNLTTDLNNKIGTTLSSGQILIGNASNIATPVTPTGDVTFSNTGLDSVKGFRGIPISATILPSAGQVLQYSTSGGGVWVPATVATGGGGTITGVAVGNLPPLFSTANIGTATSPAFNYTLTNAGANTVFGNNTGTAGAPGYFSSSSLPIAGDVSGTLAATTVAKLQGKNVSATAPTITGQVLSWNNTTSVWEPAISAAAVNIYNSDGTLTANRTLTQGTNTLNFASTATTQSPATFTANSLTTGSALSVLSANAGLNSTNGFFRIFNNAVPTTASGLFARIQPNSTAGAGFTILNNGNTGIGTVAPAQSLEVNSGVANTSGVRLTNLTSTSPTSTGTALGVNSTGDIITVSVPVITKYTLGAAVSNSSTTRINITGWSFTVTAGKSYKVEIAGTYQTVITTTGGSIGFILPTGAGNIQGYAEGEISISNTVTGSNGTAGGVRQTLRAINATSTTAGSVLTTSGVTVAATPHYMGANFVFNCTTTGTLQVQFGTEINTSAATFNANSTMLVTEY